MDHNYVFYSSKVEFLLQKLHNLETEQGVYDRLGLTVPHKINQEIKTTKMDLSQYSKALISVLLLFVLDKE